MSKKNVTAKRKSIVWLSHSAKAVGGAELSLLSLVRAAIDRGHEVTVIFPDNGELVKLVTASGARTEIINGSWWIYGNTRSMRKAMANFKAVRKIASVLNDVSADLLVTNTSVIPWGSLAAYNTGIPHYWHVREYVGLQNGLRFLMGTKLTMRWIRSTSTKIFTNSKAIMTHIQKGVPVSKMLITFPYVDVSDIQPIKRSKSKNRVDFLIVGGIAPTKNQLEAVQALSIAQSINPAIRMRIVMVGPAYDLYVNQILEVVHKSSSLSKDSVKFMGALNNPFTKIKEADAYIMCSKYEAFGRVTVEAMAAALPVIGSRSGGTPEIVDENTTGLLYEPGDVNELAQNMLRLATNVALRKRMGAAGRRRVLKVFDQQSCITPFFNEIEKKGSPKINRRPYTSSTIGAILAFIIFTEAVLFRIFAASRRLLTGNRG